MTLPSGLQTGFAIDGNKTGATPPNTFDWDDILQPPPTATQTSSFVPTGPYTTPQGFRSSGIFEGGFFWDDGTYSNCDGQGSDPTANQGSQNGNTNPWVARPANVQDKANLCSAGYAMEALSDETGLRHFMMYGYFTRRAGNGSVSIYTVFEGPEPGRCDDLLLDVLYAEGTTRFLEWRPTTGDGCANPDGPGTWLATGRSVDFAFSMGQRTEGPPLGNQQQDTFGEYAIDLTAAGLFGDEECSTFAVTSLMSRTGAAETATISDFFFNTPEPLRISNCGTLTVTKQAPVGQTADEFGYRITNESSQGVVVPPDQTSIEGTVTPGQTQTHTNVLSSSLLHLEEIGIPPPWGLVSAECSYTDQVGVRHTVDVTDPSTPFTLLGGGQTDCVLVNDAALVTVAKETLPDGSDQAFDFDVGGNAATLTDGQSASFAVPAGEPITLTEGAVDGWMPPGVECSAPSSSPDDRSVTVTPVLGENIVCTFTNTRLATITIEKRVPQENAGVPFGFTGDLGAFTLTPAAVPQTTGAVDSQQFQVPPGEYTVTEDVPEGFVLTDLACWDPPYGYEAEFPVDPPTVTVTLQPGSEMTCSFENSEEPENATLIVHKVTTPMVEWDLAFPFRVTGPEGFEPTTFDLNTIGNDWSWVAQNIPVGTYTITEGAVPGWSVQSVQCRQADGAPMPVIWDGAGTTTATLEAGAIVTCVYTNRAELAGVTLTKTTANIAPAQAWTFNVSLSPAPGTSTTLSGTGPGSATTSWSALLPGQRYVVQEAAEPGWNMGPLTCTDQGGPVTDLDTAPLTFTFDAAVGQQLACGMTNTGRTSTVELRKVSSGLSADYPWSFDMQISPLPPGATNPTTVSGVGQSAVTVSWPNLLPGQVYEITEINLPDEVTQRLESCTGAQVEQIEGGIRFTPPLDGVVSCSLSNLVDPVPATLTKTTTQGDGTFTFDLVTLSTDDTPVVLSTTTVGQRAEVPFSLVPGVRYALTERDLPGWTEGAIVCTVTPATGEPFTIPDVSNFAVSVGDNVACEAENDIAPGTVSFTKSTAGITPDFEWSFPVTLTAADGEGQVLFVSGTGPGSSSVAWPNLPPGRYTLEEGGLQGWDAGQITCGLGGGDADPFTPGIQIDLLPGQSWACSVINTARPATAMIRKRTAGIGETFPWSFTFAISPVPDGQEPTATLTGAGPGLGVAAHTWTALTPGAVYSLTETAPGPGWTAQGIVCDDGTGTAIDASRLVAAPGAAYSCIADNTAPAVTGSITKTTVGGDGEFEFLLDTVPTSGSPTALPVTTTDGTGSVALPTLLPGNRYSLTEAALEGWQNTGALACTRTPQTGPPVPIPDLADFTVQAGDRIACQAQNTANGRVILYKEVHGTGDQPRDFEFTSNVAGFEAFTVNDVVDDGNLVATVIEDVAPGAGYYFQETTDVVEPPTVLADLACTYGGVDHSGTPEDRENRRMEFEVLPGQTTECYFTNAVQGSLILIKRSVPANFNQDFDFSITGPSIAPGEEEFVINSDPNVAGAIRSWSGLLGGTYRLTEGELPPGWSLNTEGGATFCNTEDGWTLDPEARSITIELDAADVVTCFFSNRAATASVSVTKSTQGLADGTAWSFPLTLSPAAGVTPGGTQTVSGTAPGTGTVTWQNLAPGVTYTLSEPATSGWTAGTITCAGLQDASPAAGFQFVAGVGMSLTCTVQNTASTASVAVSKTVSGVGATLPWSFELTIAPDATPVGPQTVSGVGNTTSAPVTWTNLVPGTRYTLAETAQAGWVQGLVRCPGIIDESTEPGLQFTATPGQALQCGISNAGVASRVSIMKATTGVGGGVAWSFPMVINPPASPQATQTLTGTGSATSPAATWTNLVPGVTYTITEPPSAGWNLAGITCTGAATTPVERGISFVAPADTTVTCQAANTAQPGALQVTKTASGVDPALVWSFDLALDDGSGVPQARTVTNAPGGSPSATWQGLVPGQQYTLSEAAVPAWAAGDLVCGQTASPLPYTFTAQVGQSLSCTLDNAAEPAALTGTKTVAGVADDLAWEFGLSLTPGLDPETQSAAGVGNVTSEEVAWTGLVPGVRYTFSEVAQEGWIGGEPACAVVGGADLVDADPVAPGFQVVPGPGQSIACGVTNTAPAGGLQVAKTASGADAGLVWSFDLVLDDGSGTPQARTVTNAPGGSPSAAWEGLVPGQEYTLSETAVPGWAAGDLVCGEDASPLPFTFTAGVGQSLACTLDNAAAPATVSFLKTVEGVADGFAWSFPVTLDPPAGGGGTQQATGTGSTSSEALTWIDLVPGTTYRLTEEVGPGFLAGAFECSVDGVPVEGGLEFVPAPGEAIVCGATNTAETGGLQVAKTASGVDPALIWSFDLTLDDGSGTPQARTVTNAPSGSPSAVWPLVPGVEYTLSETAVPGWAAGDLVCGEDASPLPFTFTAGVGQSLACTLDNAAAPAALAFIKTVEGVAEGVAWSFPVTLDPPATGGGTQQATGTGSSSSGPVIWTDLVPGTTYRLTEATVPGFVAGPFECSIAGSGIEGGVELVPAPGDQVICELTNTAQAGDLQVTKTASGVGPGLAWSFELTLDDGSGTPEVRTVTNAPDGSASAVWQGLVAGQQYTLSETAVPGWASGALVCGEAESPLPFTFTAGVGQSLSCTLDNAAAPAELTGTKTASGVADDFAWEFDLSLGPGLDPETQTVAGVGNVTSDEVGWTGLVPGATYTFSEVGQEGWASGDPVCAVVGGPDLVDADPVAAGFQVVPGPGQSIACGVANEPQQVSVVATKTVVGLAEDLEWSFDLTLGPADGPGVTQTVEGTGNASSPPVSWTDLVPGVTYTLVEDVPQGWNIVDFVCTAGDTLLEDASEDPGFQLRLAPGQEATCGIVNSPGPLVPGTGQITKATVGGDGDFVFLLQSEGLPDQPVTVTTSGGSGSSELLELVPGLTYSLTELPAEGWVATQELACTVTPATGGEPAPIDDLTSFEVEPGDAVACTATNTRLGSIVVSKAVDGPDATFGFTASWLEPQEFTIATSGQAGTVVFDGVAPGTHTVAELPTEGYDGTGLLCEDGLAGGTESTVEGLVGTIGLDPGETVTCTFTNTAWGVLIVDKATDPPDDDTSFGFTWGPAGAPQESFALTGASQPFVTPRLEPGDYTVSEDGAGGWDLESLECTGSSAEPVYGDGVATVRVAAGDAVLCRFTNVRTTALDLQKSVVRGPVDQGEGAYELEYRITVTNEGETTEEYDLEDRLEYGGRVEILDASVESDDAETNPAWDGVEDVIVAEEVEIAPDVTHTFDVHVTASVPVDLPDAERVCQDDGGEEPGGGFVNTARLLGFAGEPPSTRACTNIPPQDGPTPTTDPPPPPTADPPVADPGYRDRPLPPTGGALWITALAGLSLLAGTGLLLTRRRRT